MNELEQQIEIVDEAVSKKIANAHLKYANSYEHGNARKQLVEEIVSRMGAVSYTHLNLSRKIT